jgi:hypothetical protein
MRQELDGVKAQVGQVGAGMQFSARQRMHADLDTALPSWRDTNNNPQFLNWLALPDPFSGVIRHNLLKEAYARSQTPRVLAFFKGFLSGEAAEQPAANGRDTKGGNRQQPPKVSLTELAAPGRAKTPAPSGPGEKPSFTRAQITRFYADVAANRYAGRDAEKNKLESQIFEASREGRVT